MKQHKVYFYTELKRLFQYSAGFFMSLLVAGLLCVVLILLAGGLLPETLQVKPFRVAVCVEGEDLISEYIKSYIQNMKSTEGILEFDVWDEAPRPEEMESEELAACIIIPEKTPVSILNGENVPVKIFFPQHVNNTQWYLQTKLIRGLAESGMTYIDVPQTESILLYEILSDDEQETKQQLEQIIDLFHLRMVMERESWFQDQTVKKMGAYQFKEYYLASAAVLILLLWGVGIGGGYICGQQMQWKLLQKRRGVSLFWQYFYSRVVFCIPYVLFLICCIGMLIFVNGSTSAGNAITGKVCYRLCWMVILAALQSALFFQLFEKTSSGIFALLVWNLAGYVCAGGVLPDAFLPEKVTKAAGFLPQGICMQNMLSIVSQEKGMMGQNLNILIGYSIFLFLAGLCFEYFRAWRIRKA